MYDDVVVSMGYIIFDLCLVASVGDFEVHADQFLLFYDYARELQLVSQRRMTFVLAGSFEAGKLQRGVLGMGEVIDICTRNDSLRFLLVRLRWVWQMFQFHCVLVYFASKGCQMRCWV